MPETSLKKPWENEQVKEWLKSGGSTSHMYDIDKSLEDHLANMRLDSSSYDKDETGFVTMKLQPEKSTTPELQNSASIPEHCYEYKQTWYGDGTLHFHPISKESNKVPINSIQTTYEPITLKEWKSQGQISDHMTDFKRTNFPVVANSASPKLGPTIILGVNGGDPVHTEGGSGWQLDNRYQIRLEMYADCSPPTKAEISEYNNAVMEVQQQEADGLDKSTGDDDETASMTTHDDAQSQNTAERVQDTAAKWTIAPSESPENGVQSVSSGTAAKWTIAPSESPENGVQSVSSGTAAKWTIAPSESPENGVQSVSSGTAATWPSESPEDDVWSVSSGIR